MAAEQGASVEPSGGKAEGKAVKEGGLRGSDVLAGACVASVAAVAGGYLGVLGSVLSAFLVSMISGITLPLLRAHLRAGEDKLRALASKKGAGSRAAKQSAPGKANRDPRDHGARVEDMPPAVGVEGPQNRRRQLFRIGLATTLIGFLAAFGGIFVVQSMTGRALSSGTAQLQKQVTGRGPAATPTASPSPTVTASAPSASAEPSSAAPTATATPESTPTVTTSPEPTPVETGNPVGNPTKSPAAEVPIPSEPAPAAAATP